MTYYKHYFRLFRKINKLPRARFTWWWHDPPDSFHHDNLYVIAVCIAEGYVECKGNYLRVTRKGRNLK